MSIDYTQLQKLANLTAAHKENAARQLMRMIDETAEKLTGPYPAIERQGWADKEAQARGNGNARTAAMVSEEAALVGETTAALETRVIAKADAYRSALTKLTAVRRIRQKEIQTAGGMSDIESSLLGAAADLATILAGRAPS